MTTGFGNRPIPTWLEHAFDESRLIKASPEERQLVRQLLEHASHASSDGATSAGTTLAAAFDLLVALVYYSRVSGDGWVACTHGPQPLLIYPFTNACSRCILRNEFFFHKANKPGSGEIGKTTSRLLCVFLEELLKLEGRDVQIRKGREPIDVAMKDNDEDVLLLAEVKAAPLTTLALAIAPPARPHSHHRQSPANLDHEQVDAVQLQSLELSMLVPVLERDAWKPRLVPIGRPPNVPLAQWPTARISEVLEDDDAFFSDYLTFWERALSAYSRIDPAEDENEPEEGIEVEPRENSKDEGDPANEGRRSPDPVYWLTNACGAPFPRPSHWPQRSNGKGFESISDSKSSVGMDRTDDIKKGIYQVLKIGAGAKPVASEYAVKVALISNIHAVRHYEDYFADLEDFVWTIAKSTDATVPELFNLADGIIAFTETRGRDEWVQRTFDFDHLMRQR